MMIMDRTQILHYDRIINHLILNSFSISNRGLLNGRMGITLAFYHIGHVETDNNYIKFGNKLLESIIETLDTKVPVNFADGFCGIGWGIEYLLYHGFIKCSSCNLLEDFNKCIETVGIGEWNLSLEYGLEGLLHYVLAHISNNERDGKICFSHSYLKNLYNRLCSSCFNDNSDIQLLAQSYINWYNYKKMDYKFDLKKFTSKNIDFNIPFEDIPVSLSNGLAGYIINSIRIMP